MKSIFYSFIFLFSLIAFNAQGQTETAKKTIKYYYEDDTTWQKEVESLEECTYYAEYFYLGANEWRKHGTYRETYKDETPKEKGFYEKGKTIGRWQTWYPNGKMESEYHFEYDSTSEKYQYLFDNYWNAEGNQLVTDGTGAYLSKYSTGKVSLQGNYKNHLKDENWKSYTYKGSLDYSENWDEGKFEGGWRYLIKKQKAGYNNIDSIFYDVVEQNAVPTNGYEGFYKSIGKNLKYPRSMKRQGVEGKVFVSFTVEANGSLSSFQVVRGIHKDADELSVNAIKQSSGNWIPGRQRGVRVRQKMTLPITFRLN